MSAGLDRARILLFVQSRHDLAEEFLRRELAIDPNNPYAHALLALCLLRSKRHEEATREAEEAVRLAPDYAYAHYVLAQVLVDRDKPKKARAAVEEAIRLEPENADYLALLSGIEHDEGSYRDALTVAERALGIEPEHTSSANLRTMALAMLGRRKEAEAANRGALAGDPQNALAHANRGWLCLRRSDAFGAMGAFREALRLDPGLGWAREGLVEALKAKHRVYRVVLRYLLWGGWARMALIIGLIVGFFVSYMMALADGVAWMWPVAIVLLLALVLTQMGDTFFNMLLWLRPSGRLVLSPPDGTPRTWVDSAGVLAKAIWIVACVLLALLVYTAGWLTLNIFVLLAGRFFRWLADAAMKEGPAR